MAKNKPHRKSKKSLANNPLILVLVLVLFAAVGANSLGLLDGLFSGGQAPALPPSPKKPAADTANVGQPGTAAGSQAADSASAVAAADPAAQEIAKQPGSAAKVPAAEPAVIRKEESKPKPKWDVPEFAFAVGRENPFAEVAALKTKPASSSNTASAPKTTVPVKNPVSSQTPGSAASPTPGQTKPAIVEKPKEPWESWIFTGLSEHGSLRFAIIETPENAYIVREGDRIEGIWLVEKITGAQVTLRSSARTIVLVLGGEGK